MNEQPTGPLSASHAATPPATPAHVAQATATSAAALPPLMRDVSFWGMGITQFLGAFNDNLFKQLILLLATPALIAGAEQTKSDQQGLATIIFALAFILFSGIAGWLADRTSKRTLIILSKAAEIGVMLLGLVGFLFYEQIGFYGMLVVLFLMGVQSAFFGPPKYGILPETVRSRDLPRANGIFLMFTFVAIIFGMGLAGLLLDGGEHTADGVWRGSLVCVGIAVAGTLTSLLVRRVPPAAPQTPLRTKDLLVPMEMVRLLLANRQLRLALLVTSTFWMLGSVVQQAVNALGKTQLGLTETWTSVLAAMMAVGIPVGCVLGGYLSQKRINPRVVTSGATGMVLCLALLALPGGPQNHLLGFYGSIPVLVALGFFTGMFVVPIQVLLQVLPPAEDKGRMIGVMNLCNFFGILLGGVIFKVVIALLEANQWPRNLTFVVTAAIMLPVALLYRPEERELGD